jgi:hypothetical protein
MHSLTIQEIEAVSGAGDIPTVYVTGQRMTDEQKYEYDLSVSTGFLDTATAAFTYLLNSTFG